MFEAKQLRKHALECLCLQADCMEMAGVAYGHNVQSHFVSMAEFWGALAVSGPSVDADSDIVDGEIATIARKSPHVVLIVEHDELLKSLTANIMKNAGFVALQASNADEAAAILEARSDIALLFTGITMPSSMNGLSLAHMVAERWPTVKIVIASSQIRLAGPGLPKGSSFFLKPYNAERMISEIRLLIGP
jgi:two-component system, response regulator PdtaR